MTPISWERVARALQFYQRCGYVYLETPWVVSEKASSATFPESVGLSNGTFPVGSAEQGFIQLMMDGSLKPGAYVSAGPCFRPQDAGRSEYHFPWFFKVELLHYQEHFPTLETLEFAQIFLGAEAGDVPLVEVPQPEDTWDLECNGIEVGSYGSRTLREHSWTYGTGLAEPRFSLALQNKPLVDSNHV